MSLKDAARAAIGGAKDRAHKPNRRHFDVDRRDFRRLMELAIRTERKVDALCRAMNVVIDNQQILESEIMTSWKDITDEIADEKQVTAGLATALDHVDTVLTELRNKSPDGPTAAEMDAAIADLRANKASVVAAVKRGTEVEAEPAPVFAASA